MSIKRLSLLSESNKSILIKTYRLVHKSNQKYLPFHLRDFSNGIYKPIFYDALYTMESDSANFKHFIGRW